MHGHKGNIGKRENTNDNRYRVRSKRVVDHSGNIG